MANEHRLANIAIVFELVDERLRDSDAGDPTQRDIADLCHDPKRPGGLAFRKGAGRTIVQSV